MRRGKYVSLRKQKKAAVWFMLLNYIPYHTAITGK